MTSNDPAFEFDHRKTNRSVAELEAVVRLKNADGEVWKEVTKITTVSRNGAGFELERECPVGRLLTIVLPMPRNMRAYDLDEELYPVMGIVQNCYETKVNGKTVYHIGVGFIGKVVPQSYRDDPMQNYRIEGMGPDGMWQVVETARAFKARKHPRIWVRIPVNITVLHQDTRTALKDSAMTQNVAASGVSVESDLVAEIGDKVKFACPALDFFSMAIVRNRKVVEGSPTTIHLEFITGMFPMEKLVRGPVPPHAPPA